MSKARYAQVEAAVRAAMERDDLPEWSPGFRQLPQPVQTRVPQRLARFYNKVGVTVNHRDGTQEVVADNSAQFIPENDEITLPPVEAYEKLETYAQAAFHEATHWAGHFTRLRRPQMIMAYLGAAGRLPEGVGKLAQYHEEMIAEFGSLFLTAAFGIEPDVERSAGYIRNYSKAFGDDEREWVISEAAAQGRKAAEWLLHRDVREK